MTIYDILLLAIFLIPFVNRKKLKTWNINSYMFFVLLCMIAIPGLRHVNVGLDTANYERMFREYTVAWNQLFSLGVRTEEGYLILNKLVHDIFGSFVFMQIISASLFVVPIYWLVSKYSSKPWLSLAFVVVYIFYYTCFNEVRLSIALGISCFAFNYLIKGNWKKYIITVIAAYFFHHSAMIIMPLVVFVFQDKLKFWQLVLLATAAVVVSYFMADFYAILNSFQENTYGINKETGGYGLLAIQLLILALALLRAKQVLKKKENLASFYFVATAAILFPICHATPVMFRLEQYCWLPMIILVPNIISSFKSRSIQAVEIISFLVIGYVFLYMHSMSESNQIVPYKFYWEKI
jgi:hypothetical protein